MDENKIFQCYRHSQLQYEFEEYKEAREYIECYGGEIQIKSKETDQIMQARLELMERRNGAT